MNCGLSFALIGASLHNRLSINSRRCCEKLPRMPSRLSEYRPGQLRVKAKPHRTRRYAALTRSFNPGRIFHYPGMSIRNKSKSKNQALPLSLSGSALAD